MTKIYLYDKDSYEAKYQFLINKQESPGLNSCNSSKTFFEYSNDMDDIYKNIEEFNPNKRRKILFLIISLPTCLIIKNSINSNVIIYQRKKAKHFSCFYYTILFLCSKKY